MIKDFDPENMQHLRVVEEWQAKYDEEQLLLKEKFKLEGWSDITEIHPFDSDHIPFDVIRCKTQSEPEGLARVCDLPVCSGMYWKPLFEESVS